MPTQAEKAAAFRALHERPGAFIIPSVGGALSRLALAAFLRGAREMKDKGGFTWVRDTVPSKELKAIFKEWQ